MAEKSKKWHDAMKEMHAKGTFQRAVREGQATSRRMGRPRKVYAGFVDPDGNVYRDIDNLTAFARDFELDRSSLVLLAQGKIQQHKGWTRYEPDQ